MKNLLNKYLPGIIIIAGAVFQSVALIKTALPYRLGLGYWGPLARDGVWHEALVGQLLRGIPPINPGFAGADLANYHYFYDAFVALLSKLTFLDPRYLLYAVVPFFTSIFLGQAIYFFSYRLFKNRTTAIVSLFFLYFGSSFGWVLGVLRGTEIGGESAFWANQPVSMNLNPPFALSLLLLSILFLVILSYSKKASFVKGIFIALITGILIGVKVYAGFVALGALCLVAVKRYVFDKDSLIIFFALVASAISFFIYKFTSSGASSLVIVQPFWLIDTMIDAGDRVGIVQVSARRFMYLADKKVFHYLLLQIFSVGLFFVGNLGTRLVALLNIKRPIKVSDIHLYLCSAMFLAAIPPLIFVQKGNGWNIVQFFYYFLFIAGIYAANGLALMWQKSGWKKALAIFILILTPISSIATFRSYLYPNPPAYLSQKEYEALSYLAAQEYGTVLVHPYVRGMRESFSDPYILPVYADTAYVSAHSGHSVYIEDVEQQIILNVDYESRLKKANTFFKTKDTGDANKFLSDHNIDYVYLPKIYQLPNAEAMYEVRKIFENSEVNIYKVIR